jgi:hypothetical protein
MDHPQAGGLAVTVGLELFRELAMRMCIATLVLLVAAASASAQPVQPLPVLSTEGRFLYANDDDWDWASPLGANEPSRLTVYGKMPWSALDWMEDGLDQVRGVLLGTPPLLGDYLTMADLNKIRGAGPKVSYKQVPHNQKGLAAVLRDKDAPNVVIVMQDIGFHKVPHIFPEDVAAAYEFVARGGRLLILDDWKYCRGLVTPYLDDKKFVLAKLPALTEADRKKVVELVKTLDSNTFTAREQATAELLKMGPAILPVLVDLKPVSVEQEMRLQKLVKKLEPPPVKVDDGDGWLQDAAKRASELHKLCELKHISRNGNKAPGHALCLRLPVKKS